MRHFLKFLYVCIVVGTATLSAQARQFKIAVLPFYEPTGDSDLATRSNRMRDIIINNLQRSHKFVAVQAPQYRQQLFEIVVKPNFDEWGNTGTEILVTTQVSQSDGEYTYTMDVWFIAQSRLLITKQYRMTGFSLTDRLAHMISDDIYDRISGGKYFDSQILFVAQTVDDAGNPIQRLAVMDQDGGNLQYLSDGKNLVISPRFSPDGRYIIYVSYKKNNTAGVFVRDLKTKKQTFIATDRTVSYTPRFAPDNKKVIFSNLVDGRADIWVMQLRRVNGKIKFDRLTDTPYMDMAPFYAPDGTKIVFMSDRSGTPQLYTMNPDGTGVQRISRGTGAYTTPVWSPTGEYIAFTKGQGENFHIGIMKPDGSEEQLLTTSYLDEGPAFSPNGKFIIFGRQQQNGDAYIMSIGIDGKNLSRIATPTKAAEPDWSALRKP